MSTSIAALEANGISIEAANAWLISHLSNPAAIFNTAKAYGLSSTDIANIVSVSIPSVSATLVESFFNTQGFDSSELTGTPTISTDPVLSDASIHQLIQTKVDYENLNGDEILYRAAELDIQSDYDGTPAVMPGETGYEQLIANYKSTDLDDESDYIEDYEANNWDDIPTGSHFDSDSYNQQIKMLAAQYFSYQDPLKEIYDDVMHLDDNYGTINIDDDVSDYNPNNDLIIFSTKATQNTIVNFSDNDDLYIANAKAHFLGTTGGSMVGTVVNWAQSNASELSHNVIDVFVFDDGANTYVVGEKTANLSYDNAVNANDFSVITLVGTDSSDLEYDDGFIAYA